VNYFELFSPEIKWWNLNITTTQSNLDSLDQLYGEEGDNKLALMVLLMFMDVLKQILF
jgi:hypothetical protein